MQNPNAGLFQPRSAAIGIAASALLAALSGCSSTSVSTGYYNVSGSTGRALDRSIARNGPMSGDAFAATQLTIVPVSIVPVETVEGCKLASAKFKLNAKITMPRWTDRNGASADLRDGFDMFADYAKLHEGIHVKIGEAAVQEMESEVLKIPPQKNCDILQTKVKSVLARVQAHHHKTQLAFDAAEDKRIKALLNDASKR
jgi:predicted secreted Zn-dependent protease